MEARVPQGASSFIPKGVAPSALLRERPVCIGGHQVVLWGLCGGGVTSIRDGQVGWLDGACSSVAGEAGTELCGPNRCSSVYTWLPGQNSARECGNSIPHTQTLRLKLEIPGHLTWAFPVSSADLPVASFPSPPQTAELGTCHLLELVIVEQRAEALGEKF